MYTYIYNINKNPSSFGELFTNYFILLYICTWQLCYIFSMMALVLISHSAFSLCTIF